jgi:hypothetical protein
MSNTLMVIHPYKYEDMWVFDDEKAGLVKEPFVSGADDMIDVMVKGFNDPENGFNIVFGAIPFPGHNLELDWLRADSGGNWYKSIKLNMEGWLCPALFKYFESAPKKLYAQFKSK